MTAVHIGPHTLHLADAYALRPRLGFFEFPLDRTRAIHAALCAAMRNFDAGAALAAEPSR